MSQEVKDQAGTKQYVSWEERFFVCLTTVELQRPIVEGASVRSPVTSNPPLCGQHGAGDQFTSSL